jgi:hypothetical protein
LTSFFSVFTKSAMTCFDMSFSSFNFLFYSMSSKTLVTNFSWLIIFSALSLFTISSISLSLCFCSYSSSASVTSSCFLSSFVSNCLACSSYRLSAKIPVKADLVAATICLRLISGVFLRISVLRLTNCMLAWYFLKSSIEI